ncbi:hypothetical protein B0H14DRAFT_2640025 [Mycena olivaceomarginata]|nr:hypothetical protein B0H14DRAFT_2640025 [Mycena olivaceomarginata]
MPIRQKVKREGLRMQKKEDKIQEAVVGIQSGRFKNPREAAEELGIPKQAATKRVSSRPDKRYLELWTRRWRAAGVSTEEPQDPQPLMDIRNTAGGSSQMDVDMPPPRMLPPDAQYSFPDDWIPPHSSAPYPPPAPGFTWILPPSHHPYNHQIGQPPPFSPAFYGNLPPSDFSSARHPYGHF